MPLAVLPAVVPAAQHAVPPALEPAPRTAATPAARAHDAGAPGHPPAHPLDTAHFQSLMAGEGHHIDPTRLQHDGPYARGCLALAAGSRSAPLRAAGAQLQNQLHRPLLGLVPQQLAPSR